MSDPRQLADSIESYVEDSNLTVSEFEALQAAWSVLDSRADIEK